MTVGYDLKVLGGLEVEKHLHAGADVAGQIVLEAGATATTTLYNVAYDDTPIVTLTPNGRVGSEYWVENISAKSVDPATTSEDYLGFRVNVEIAIDHPVVFNYIIVGADEKLAALEVLDASRVYAAPLNVSSNVSNPPSPPSPSDMTDSSNESGAADPTGPPADASQPPTEPSPAASDAVPIDAGGGE